MTVVSFLWLLFHNNLQTPSPFFIFLSFMSVCLTQMLLASPKTACHDVGTLSRLWVEFHITKEVLMLLESLKECVMELEIPIGFCELESPGRRAGMLE